MSALGEFIEKLSELPPSWRVSATRSGASVEVWAPKGDPDYGLYGYVFTDERPNKIMVDRRAVAAEAAER